MHSRKDLRVGTPKIDIYTKFACPYCMRAKMLLESKGVEFDEFDITMGGPKREEMLARAIPNDADRRHNLLQAFRARFSVSSLEHCDIHSASRVPWCVLSL